MPPAGWVGFAPGAVPCRMIFFLAICASRSPTLRSGDAREARGIWQAANKDTPWPSWARRVQADDKMLPLLPRMMASVCAGWRQSEVTDQEAGISPKALTGDA